MLHVRLCVQAPVCVHANPVDVCTAGSQVFAWANCVFQAQTLQWHHIGGNPGATGISGSFAVDVSRARISPTVHPAVAFCGQVQCQRPVLGSLQICPKVLPLGRSVPFPAGCDLLCIVYIDF